MNKSKISIILSSILALTVTACGSGGGSSGGGGGGDNNVTVKTLSTLSNANTPYYPTCMYKTADSLSWILVKRDGSGTGVQYFESTGVVNNTSGLPILTNNDLCQPNTYQLTWVNSATENVLNVLDPFSDTTTSFNLGNAGLSGSQVSSTSFAYDHTDNYLIANSNFSNNNFGLSKILGTNPTTYSVLPVGSLSSSTNSVLYGFSSFGGGIASTIGQLLPASSGTPASYVTYNANTSAVLLQVNFVDSTGAAISAMSATVDFLPISSQSNQFVIETGLVQPSLYICKIVNSASGLATASCGNPITSSILASQYKIMRLLSFDGTNIVFYGLNLTNQTVGIFSMSQS